MQKPKTSMLPLKDKIRLQHMLDYSMEAMAIVRGKKRSDLNDDRMMELSLVRLIEIIGEAASRVEANTRQKCSSISWLQIVGMQMPYGHVDAS